MFLKLDGEILGVLEHARTAITGLRPGRRRIEVFRSDGTMVPFVAAINVRQGKTTELNVQIVSQVRDSVRTAKNTMVWSGFGLTSAGAGVLAFALLGTQSAQFVQPCQGASCAGEVVSGFSRFCDYSQTFDVTCNGLSSGLAAPTGYSLVLSGLAVAASGYWGDDEGYFRWWGPIAGLAVGSISYGLSSGLNAP